jgi:hypothetical protein
VTAEAPKRSKPQVKVGDIVLADDSWFIVDEKLRSQRWRGRLVAKPANGSYFVHVTLDYTSLPRAWSEIASCAVIGATSQRQRDTPSS